MPSLTLPGVTDSSFRKFVSLHLQANVDLDGDTLGMLRATGLSFEDNACHVSFREPVEAGPWRGELSGFVGIHDVGHPDQSDKGPKSRYMHYQLELRERVRPRANNLEAWNKLLAAITGRVSAHAAAVGLKVIVPESAVLAVKLPIVISSGETPGFSHIRGIRLVQPDPNNAKADLYSVVIDTFERGASLHISAVVTAAFDADILVTAFRRASEIADLAATATEQ